MLKKQQQKFRLLLLPVIVLLVSFNLASCNSETKISTFNKCRTLGNESILYARANYVKLFHHFNPNKFENTFEKVKDFDHITHRNIINTYDFAVRKLKASDPATEVFITSCKKLAEFSKNFVDQAYPRAIAHKSQYDVLSDDFFNEINQLVKFDHNIGNNSKDMNSFKQLVTTYEKALKAYEKTLNEELSSGK